MALSNLRPLSFGEILDGAFTLYRRNFATFILTALIPTGILIAALVVLGGGMFAAMASGDPTSMLGAVLGAGLLVMVVAIGSMLVMYGALAREAAQSYTGQPTSLGDGMRAGLGSALRLFGAGIVATVGFVVVMFGLGLVMMVLTMILAQLGGAVAVLGTVLVFVGVAAAYLAAIAMLFAVLPAVVVEGAGPIEALERSFELARGAVPRVLGMMLVTLLITYLPMMAVLAMTGGFAQMMNPDAVPSMTQLVTQQVLAMGVSILTAPFMVAVIVLLYFDRRVRTEALDVQMMADRLALAGD
jgi:hypothetical protein